MDLICPVCAEPVDNDYFHDLVDDGTFSSYREAAAAFRRSGCEGIGETHSENRNSYRADVSAAMFDLLGDDMDGAAAMMEDFEYFGMV